MFDMFTYTPLKGKPVKRPDGEDRREKTAQKLPILSD
jgi:hypothetical protein